MDRRRVFVRKFLFVLGALAITAVGLLALGSPAAEALPARQWPLIVTYPSPVEPDPQEDDDACSKAGAIGLNVTQQHNFHSVEEQDWLAFTAEANKTYIVDVTKIGSIANPVIALYSACDEPPMAEAANLFSSKVLLQWNATKNGVYYIKLQGYDPELAGAGTEYSVRVRLDEVPPGAPGDPRCFAINPTTIGVQWQRSIDLDVTGYEVHFTRVGQVEDGVRETSGARTTYAEVDGLTEGETYEFRIYALDFSRNKSPAAGPVTCLAQDPPDRTAPAITVQNPQISDLYTTTTNLLTFTGLAQDAGRNLSRVNVANVTRNDDDWDYSLAGEEDTFRVEDMRLQVGLNLIKITAYDEVGNLSERTLQVNRVGIVRGAAIIVAGHNEHFGLQLNIYNAADRAFRVFNAGGFDPDDIYYIAPTPQDADGDGVNDVDATSSPAAVQAAFETWARDGARTGPGKPFFVYFVDHGLDEKFCVSGCGAGQAVSPLEVNSWLDALEAARGVDQASVIVEACRSGSFINREGGNPLGGLGKAGRVIITSTDAQNNAYASAEGAFFSDAFFSCAVNNQDLKSCFDQGVAAVQATGVSQRPQLDDNGDGLFNGGDGALARTRYLTNLFTSTAPTIDSARRGAQRRRRHLGGDRE